MSDTAMAGVHQAMFGLSEWVAKWNVFPYVPEVTGIGVFVFSDGVKLDHAATRVSPTQCARSVMEKISATLEARSMELTHHVERHKRADEELGRSWRECDQSAANELFVRR